MTRPHTCHARGCEVPVKPELLMCYAHWRKVPSQVQRAVWAAYRPGQCDDMRPSKDWHLAADAAIGYVAKSGGLGLTAKEREAMMHFGFADTRAVPEVKTRTRRKTVRSRRVAGLTFPSDGDVEVQDVGEDGVTGSTDICGFCAEPRASHTSESGGNPSNDCKRFRSV
jgi:hypothetical protein